MSIELILAACADRGILLSTDGDKLKVDAPTGAMTPDLRQSLTEHKAALLAHLGAERATSAPEVLHIPLEAGSCPSVWLAERGPPDRRGHAARAKRTLILSG